MYPFTLPTQPPSNRGICETDGLPPSEQPFADIRSDGFPVASFDLGGNSNVTYDTQIGVVGFLVGCGAPPFEFTDADVQNRPPMYPFDLLMQPTSNEGMGEMDGPPLSEHSLADICDNGLPVAPLGLRRNSGVTYDPQIDVVGSCLAAARLPLNLLTWTFMNGLRCTPTIRRCHQPFILSITFHLLCKL